MGNLHVIDIKIKRIRAVTSEVRMVSVTGRMTGDEGRRDGGGGVCAYAGECREEERSAVSVEGWMISRVRDGDKGQIRER